MTTEEIALLSAYQQIIKACIVNYRPEKGIEDSLFVSYIVLGIELGVTFESLHDAIGLTRATISRWKAGRSLPRVIVRLTVIELIGSIIDEMLAEKAVA